MTEERPNAELLSGPDTAHSIHMEAPDESVSAALQFLEGR